MEMHLEVMIVLSDSISTSSKRIPVSEFRQEEGPLSKLMNGNSITVGWAIKQVY